MSEVLEQIRKAIEQSGTSRYAISKATGIDQGQLSKLMSGQCSISIEKLQKLLDFLGLEIIVRPKRKSKGSK